MRWWSKGDGSALSAVALGTVSAVLATSMALTWVAQEESTAAGEAAVHPAPATAELEAAAVELLHRQTSVAFRASSFRESDLVQGDYAGRLSHDGSVFRLSVPYARLRHDASHSDASIRVRGIRLTLVEYGSDRMEVVARGKLHLIRHRLYPGDDIPLENLLLTLEGVTEYDVQWPRQLVIEHVGIVEGNPAMGLRESWATLEGDVLQTLFEWDPYDGC